MFIIIAVEAATHVRLSIWRSYALEKYVSNAYSPAALAWIGRTMNAAKSDASATWRARRRRGRAGRSGPVRCETPARRTRRRNRAVISGWLLAATGARASWAASGGGSGGG